MRNSCFTAVHPLGKGIFMESWPVICGCATEWVLTLLLGPCVCCSGVYFSLLVPSCMLSACSAVSELEILAGQRLCSLNSSTAAKSVFYLKQNNWRQSLRWRKVEFHFEGLWTGSMGAGQGCWQGYCSQLRLILLPASFSGLFSCPSLVSPRPRA